MQQCGHGYLRLVRYGSRHQRWNVSCNPACHSWSSSQAGSTEGKIRVRVPCRRFVVECEWILSPTSPSAPLYAPLQGAGGSFSSILLDGVFHLDEAITINKQTHGLRLDMWPPQQQQRSQQPVISGGQQHSCNLAPRPWHCHQWRLLAVFCADVRATLTTSRHHLQASPSLRPRGRKAQQSRVCGKHRWCVDLHVELAPPFSQPSRCWLCVC